MAFNSIAFLLLFLPIFLVFYWAATDQYRNMVLLAGSLVFYTMGDVRYLPVLLLSLLANYYLGLHLRVRKRSKNRRKKKSYIHVRKWLLLLAIAGNVGVWALFKTGVVMGGLPLGMSFYTFQILSYLIDVYRGDIPMERSLVNFSVYVAMFPRLMSGPIFSYGEVSADMARRRMTAKSLQSGLELFTAGLALKVLLADRVGILWQEVHTIGFESISTPLAWLAAIAYSMKLYFDFYGYSLMAIGLGEVLGFSLPANFREPYMARSIREFYRRWHITLGRWFTRYVYIPLGGSRSGELRTVGNLLIVWLMTAVWHGNTVNFLLWGLLLYLLIVLERQIGRVAEKCLPGGKGLWGKLHVLPRLYVWIVIPVTWMCFAIPDLGQLQIYLARMFGAAPQAVAKSDDWLRELRDYWWLLLAGAAACTPYLRKLYYRWKDSLPVKILLAALFWVCVRRIVMEGNNPFMYLRF